MSTVRELLKPDPPHVLFHYTTALGLLGMLDKKQIWASHTQYLNDQKEFQHAVGIIKEEISAMKKLPAHDDHKELLENMEVALDDSGSMNVCVCSFSEDGDILS